MICLREGSCMRSWWNGCGDGHGIWNKWGRGVSDSHISRRQWINCHLRCVRKDTFTWMRLTWKKKVCTEYGNRCAPNIAIPLFLKNSIISWNICCCFEITVLILLYRYPYPLTQWFTSCTDGTFLVLLTDMHKKREHALCSSTESLICNMNVVHKIQSQLAIMWLLLVDGKFWSFLNQTIKYVLILF